MSKGRLEAFTDAIIAIVVTVMVLELHPPHSGSLSALWGLRREFAIYLVSFLTLMVYWNNHHHLFQAITRIDWRVMWANSLFMLTISLFPFVTAWVGEGHVDDFGPEFAYGFIVFLTDLMFCVLFFTLVHAKGQRTQLLRGGYKRYQTKSFVSVGASLVAMLLALVWPPLTIIMDLALLLLWFIPDQQLERILNGQHGEN